MKKTCTLLMLTGLLLSACSRAPEPIQYGKDACAHCKMTIMDKRFVAEIVSAKGKVFKFDSAECMADFLKENADIASNDQTIFLVNYFDQPGKFQDAKTATFLEASSVSSPMGGNLAAFNSEAKAKSFQKGEAGKLYNWAGLLRSRP